MRRRRKKSAPIRTLILWTVSLSLISWGLWQAELLRRSLVTPPPSATTQPDIAVGSANTIAIPRDPTLTNVNTTQSFPDPNLPLITQELSIPPAHLEPLPAFDAGLTANELIVQATASLNAGQTPAARFALNEALARTLDDAQAGELRLSLANLNRAIFLGPDLLPDDPAARIVEIQPGDSFFSIARAYGLNAAFLQILNPTLESSNLKPNTGIKIVQGPFHARLIKQAGRLDLYARELYVASYAVDFPEGNYLPRGDYQISPGTKLQLPPPSSAPPARSAPLPRTWIGFQGFEPATDSVTAGWLFASAGPRGTDPKNRATGIHLSDADLQHLYDTLTEGRSHLHVEP